MYKPVKFITKVPYKDFCTYYLFNTSNKRLIPIEIENEKIESKSTPTIYNTLRRMLNALKCVALRVNIYRINDGIFYSYLTIKAEDTVMDINIDFKDGVEVAQELSLPIYVKDKILEQCGIEITKELILESMKI